MTTSQTSIKSTDSPFSEAKTWYNAYVRKAMSAGEIVSSILVNKRDEKILRDHLADGGASADIHIRHRRQIMEAFLLLVAGKAGIDSSRARHSKRVSKAMLRSWARKRRFGRTGKGLRRGSR